MKRQLIPRFILDNFQNEIYSGSFNSGVLFIDIVGFTSLSQKLMKNGTDGAEILSEIINRIFPACIDVIYKNGGFISIFAGDAFIALFPENAIDSSANTAFQIKKIFHNKGLQKTKFGTFHLSFRAGLSFGKANWKIIKNKNQNTYYFSGKAIINSQECEKSCDSGEILCDNNYINKLPSKYDFKEKKNGYYLLHSEISDSMRIYPEKKTYLKNQERFISESIINLKVSGEFREIIPCFIALENKENQDKFISQIIDITFRFGGYFKDINFTEKEIIILCYFGTPKGIENLFGRALDFALTIRYLANLKVKIGMSFGTVFTGFIENKNRCEYLAIGEIVNLAARFCTDSDWNEIRLAHSIFKNISKKYSTHFLGERNYKGFAENIQTYNLQDKIKIIKNHTSKDEIFGRKKELQKLSTLIEPIKNHKFAGIVYVHGIAGIGKSRLVNEFRKTIIPFKSKKTILKKDLLSSEIKTDFNWFFLPCDEIMQTGFNPFVHFLKEFFEQTEKNNNQKNKQNFEEKFQKLIESVKDEEIKNELVRTKSILGAMINLFRKDSLYERLDSKSRYQNILYAFKNFIKAECLKKPLILEIEDAHWIDKDSIKMLEILTRNIDNYPLLIISSCRLKDDGSQVNFKLEDVPESNFILEYLEKKAAKSLITEKLKGNISPELFELIWEKSDGNPFYIEQIILFIQENDLIEKKKNFLGLSSQIDFTTFKIPSTINSIIIARIDKLTMGLKELVKTASVLGREFAIDVLSAMLHHKPITKTLVEGNKENIWKALSEIQYIFKHSLIRESVYQMQLKKHLRELHKLAGETIEVLYLENLIEHYAELANHFEKAEIPDKAIFYFEKAGDNARDNYQNGLAIEFYEHLLGNIRKTSGYEKLKIDILNIQGAIYKLTGKWNEAESNFTESLKLSQKINDNIRMIKSGNNVGSLQKTKGLYEDALKSFIQNLKLAKSVANKEGIIQALQNIGVIYTSRDEYDEAIENLNKALKISREKKMTNIISSIYACLGVVHKKMGNYKLAMDYYKKRIEICEQIGDIQGICYAYNNIGNILSFQGEYIIAETNLQKSLNSAKKIGDILAVGSITANLGIIYMNKGEYQKSMRLYQNGLDISKEINDKIGIGQILGNMGIIYSRIGKYKKAMNCFQKRIQINEETGDKSGAAFAYGNIANLLYDKGEYQKAILSYKKMLKISQAIGYKIGIALAKGNLGSTYAKMKNNSQAITYFNDSIELEKELDLKEHLIMDLTGKANILLLQQKYREAKKISDSALQISSQIQDGESDFEIQILSQKIKFQMTDKLEKKIEIIKSVFEMLKKIYDKKDKAAIYFELAMLNHNINRIEDMKKNKNTALKYYNELFEKIPNYDFKIKIEELQKL